MKYELKMTELPIKMKQKTTTSLRIIEFIVILCTSDCANVKIVLHRHCWKNARYDSR